MTPWLILVALLGLGETECADPARTLQVDAVELVRGQEVAGDPALNASHGRFTYLFASDANRAEFLRDPQRYEIQFGGACARMGPLSGLGSTNIHAVHDGRIYIFASPQCRKGFLAAPDKLIDRDVVPLAASREAQQQGRALLELVVERMGGAARLDAVETYHEKLVEEQTSGGKTYTVTRTLTLRLPDGVRRDESWNDSGWSHLAINDQGWTISSRGADPLHRQQCQALRRESRDLLRILRARREPGIVIMARETARVSMPGHGEIELALVDVAFDATTTTLGIDPAGGRVLTMSYRGRGPNATIGTIDKTFTTFKDIGGLMLPTHVETRFESELVPQWSGTFASIAIDADVDAALLNSPERDAAAVPAS